MKAVEFIYQDTQIHFALSINKNVMVNATEMAKLFNKQVEAFMRNDNTKLFIKECLKSENSRFINVNSESDLIDSRQKFGTYMHRVLALKFAAWLDPSFEFWVFNTIDEILFGNYKKHSQAVLNKMAAEKHLEEVKAELLDNPKFLEFLQVQDYIKNADSEKQRALREEVNQMKIDFGLQ